jgi:hypothetical protein
MSSVPYNNVARASIGTLSTVTWTPFWNTPVIKKRQQLATTVPVSTEELLRLCQLNNVQSSDVGAGCVAGIYNKYCTNPSNPTLLKQCHDLYDQVFSASVFKPLGDVCPAWKKGPLSFSCANAVNAFSAVIFIGNDPEGNPTYLPLGRNMAREVVKNIFGQPKFAPCQAPFTCNWQVTNA